MATKRVLSLITFANSLDPDQAHQNNGPELNPNCLSVADTLFGIPERFFGKVHLKFLKKTLQT